MALDNAPTTFTNLAVKSLLTPSAGYTLKKGESGSLVALAIDGDVNLPAADELQGMKFTFIVTDGATSPNIVPASGDGIKGVINDGSDTGALVSYDGTDDDYLASAAASNNVGDRVTLVSDGNADWWIVEGAGVWTQTTPA